jgi:3-oxoadipate enol-lactonase
MKSSFARLMITLICSEFFIILSLFRDALFKKYLYDKVAFILMVNSIPIFKQDDIEINYIIEGEGQPLVLVHGFGTKLQGWQYQIEFFKKLMKVIALDNRGVGKSSRPNYSYSMDMFVEDLHKLLKHLGINGKIHLCGISMGGMIAQHYALKYPNELKTLILCATSEKLGKGISKMIDGLKEIDNLSFEEKMVNIFPFTFSRKFEKRLSEDKQLLDFIKDDIIFITPCRDPTTITDYENQAVAVENHDTSNLLDKIIVPTLILGANKDRLIPIHHQRTLCEKITNAKLKEIKGCGHAFTIENPDEVNEIIWDFIKEHT